MSDLLSMEILYTTYELKTPDYSVIATLGRYYTIIFGKNAKVKECYFSIYLKVTINCGY